MPATPFRASPSDFAQASQTLKDDPRPAKLVTHSRTSRPSSNASCSRFGIGSC
jgi:hypothetical protein